LAQTVQAGYHGVEINLPQDPDFLVKWQVALADVKNKQPGFVVGLQCVPAFTGSFEAERLAYKTRLGELVALKPDFINAHTGIDFLSFEQNRTLLEDGSVISARTGVPIWHETHRGRFSFHAPTLLPYLQALPALTLTADLSHFCVVSESMLEGQQELVPQILARSAHLHARIGHAQAPQVNDPRAPEWAENVTTFLGWWGTWLAIQKAKGATRVTITPEFGSLPYLPTEPVSLRPFISPFDANLWMRHQIEKHLLPNL
jgi:sugar phosphate isomerase/epimerase